ncbi:MAG: tetratricopeptide repeat protein [Candidatus Eremiobacteraeota bacterium]|nr:tetratricopeptide repeat protein [Candidatus Eremiobacteraeota bacterium]MCW5870091.1 tetratricopeptide repeat protein [Candidatus Eremiobacteraeota bacterium]
MKHTLLAALLLCGCAAQASIPQALTSNTAVQAVAPKPPETPMKLTANDGTGLELVKLESKAMIQGPLAFSELHLTFNNPQQRTLEGRFEITLPEGAAISRLAMRDPDGAWKEGEVVETQRARVAYEDALHVRQDPALLEQSAGNRFQARIFPILGQASKEIVISYSQQLGAGESYRLPLQGLPKVHELSASAQVWQGPQRTDRGQEMKLQDRIPTEDFVVQRQAPAEGLIKDNLVMFSVKPKLESQPVPVDKLLVLVDTSASAGPHYQEQLSQLQAVLEQLKGTEVRLAAFDQTVKPMQDLKELQARLPMGATNWNKALHWAEEQKGFSRVLLVGDGVITAGHERLSDFLPKLRQAGITRVDLLAGGSVRNQETLRPLADAMGGLVIDAREPADKVAEALTHKALSGVAVEVENAAWVWPQTLNGLRPGQEQLVFAELNEPARSLKVSLSGPVLDQSEIPLTEVAWPLLERAAAGARIARLTRECRDCRDEQQKNRLRAQIVDLSTRFRVVSDYTALLVLESDYDYARFGLQRKGLADIMVMGPNGLTLEKRESNYGVAIRRRRAQPWQPDPNLDLEQRFDKSPAARYEAAPGPSQAAAPLPEPARKAVSFSEADGLLDAEANVAPPGRAPSPRPRRDSMESFLTEHNANRPALSGEFAQIERLLKDGQDARPRALAWLQKDPTNVLALVAYAHALEAAGEKEEAARAYGSIIDLFPGRADMRRYAGGCLESLGENELAADTYTKAMISRPDHPSSHRLVAFAQLRLGNYQEAFERLQKGLRRHYPWGRFAGFDQVLRGDLALVGAAWAAHEPGRRDQIQRELNKLGLTLDDQASTRFVLTWETDSNDVNLTVKEAGRKGRLLANVTTGYGPECFVVPGQARGAQLSVQYSARGPMGYGMGKVEVIEHDGHGGLRFAEKPYLVMNDRASLDLPL